MPRTPILIAGPTASGKSQYALDLAEKVDGIIINADATQVYDCWQILSARPTCQDYTRVPHALYGHVKPQTPYSVGMWLQEVETVLASTSHTPIIVGGTGLYFQALTQGLHVIPPTPPQVREQGNALLKEQGLTHILSILDAQTRAHIDVNNPRRVLRAWEVQTATGRSLRDWQRERTTPALPLKQTRPYLLMPPREVLYERCNIRVQRMINDGVVQEVKRIMDMSLSQELPAMKAVGVKDIMIYLKNQCSLEEAIVNMQQSTRNYAKRQMTWNRNKCKEWAII